LWSFTIVLIVAAADRLATRFGADHLAAAQQRAAGTSSGEHQ
jgi:hypothetical protein